MIGVVVVANTHSVVERGRYGGKWALPWYGVGTEVSASTLSFDARVISVVFLALWNIGMLLGL